MIPDPILFDCAHHDHIRDHTHTLARAHTHTHTYGVTEFHSLWNGMGYKWSVCPLCPADNILTHLYTLIKIVPLKNDPVWIIICSC